jgi:hypothetical protein
MDAEKDIMDKVETLKILSVIDVVYSRFSIAKDKNSKKTLANIWYKMFIDKDYSLIGYAVKVHIATSPFPPTVADINRIIDKLVYPQITELEAWNIVSRAARRCDLREQYEELPEEIKGFMSYKDFKDIAKNGSTEGVIASNWQRSFRGYQERRKFDRIAGIERHNINQCNELTQQDNNS